MIDPSARIEAGAAIGQDVSIGPYCTIGSACHARRRLPAGRARQPHRPHHDRPAHRHLSLRFARFAAAVGALSRRADAAGGRRRLRHSRKRHHEHRHRGRRRRYRSRRPLFFHGRRPCRARLQGRQQRRRSPTMSCSAATSPSATMWCSAAASAVRQFVRIGEGAMIVGLSGVRADVIPWGMAQGPLADLVGLNVVGMRRRGFAKADIQRYRDAYRALFFGDGEFRARLERVAAGIMRAIRCVAQDDRIHPRRKAAADHGGQARRGGRGRGRMNAARGLEPGRPARADLRRRQPASGGGGFRCGARTQGRAVPAARRGRRHRGRTRFRIIGSISANSARFLRHRARRRLPRHRFYRLAGAAVALADAAPISRR